jgi:hypothetical protein
MIVAMKSLFVGTPQVGVRAAAMVVPGVPENGVSAKLIE